MSAPVDVILASLPKLTPAELAEVRLHISALAVLDGVPQIDDWLLQGIMVILDDLGLGDTVPHRFKITNRRQFYGYLDKAEKVRSVCETSVPNMTKLDRMGLGRLLARCLASYIEKFRAVSLNALLQHVDLALPALEECFPGYRQSGHLRVVLRREFPRAAG